MEEVAIDAVSDGLVAPDLASLFVPCEGGIVMSSSESEPVSRSVSVFFVLGEVLFWGNVCLFLVILLRELLCHHFHIRCLTWRRLWRPMSPLGIEHHPPCCLILASRCWRTVSICLVRWSELLCWILDSSQIPHPNPVHFRGRLGHLPLGGRICLYRR
jgi:hypothetical protein